MSFDVPLQRPPCARCRRLRLLAVSLVAGVLLCVALVLMAHAAVPAASAPQGAASAVHAASAVAAPAVASAAAAAPPSASAASAAQDLRFIYQTVVLPQGRQGTDYGPRAIVKGGVAPYTFVVEGKFPPGLELTPQGVLGGLPTAAGSYSFVLKARDASNPPMLTQQPYVLRVVAPPALSASSPPPPLKAITRDEAAVVPDPNRGQPMSYKLTADGIERLVGLVAPEEVPTPAPAEADPNAPAVPAEPPKPVTPAAPLATQPLPSADQLSALLQPLQDIEYPTQALFESGLRAAHCAYYQAQVKQLAVKKGVSVDLQCPPPAPPAAAASRPRPRNAPAPSPGELPLYQFYAELLPAELRARVIAEAAQVHLLAEAKKPEWTGGGCGCVLPRHPEELIHGFYPFWHAGDKPQTVDFSLLDRVSYMGLVLNDAGSYDAPAGWVDSRARFVREARRHGTAVDLVLYRRDWATLLQLPPARLSQFTRLAASNAVAAADAPLQDAWSRFGPVLRPFWNEPAQAYDGITLFFEDSPTDPEGKRRFRQFFKDFMLQLIEEMQRSGRAYFLNVAVPDLEMGEEGAYPFRDLLGYIERAMPPRPAGATASADVAGSARSAVRYQGTTDITVKYLVLLSSPSDERKKDLRTAIDHADPQGLEGHRRIAFFESVAPVLFYRLPDKPAPLPPVEADQLDRDLAYIKWTYNDVAFWPLPVLGTGSGDDARNRLKHNFGAPPRPVDGLCRWVCPNRTPLHLLLEALVLTSAGLAAVYLWNCRVRRLGRTYLLFLWGSVLATLLLAFAFLSCDPDLAAWRESNNLLYVLILVLCIGGVYATFRRRVEAP